MAKWFRSYFLMLKWTFLSSRPWLTLNLAVQLGIAGAFIYGIGYFYPSITPSIAKYLTTGSPTIVLLTVGLVLVPQIVASMRSEGTFDYIWSLPIPRMAHIAADATNMFGSMIPGILLSVILGKFHFNFDLNISLLVIPGVLLIAASATFVGYSIAFAVPKPMMVNIITQLMIFFVMMFSPVMYPAEQLPQWLQSVHAVLPIKYMADIMRGTLTDLPVNLGLAFSVVGAWFVGGFILTYFMVRRRN
ncbi:MAG: ABC transporter permease [Dehalococcoidales bacterium]